MSYWPSNYDYLEVMRGEFMDGNVRFPIGGSKDAVFSFLRQRGFVMSEWSDKHWGRADGIALHIYGTGSKARIYDKDGLLMADDALDGAVLALENAARKAIPKPSGR